MTFYEGLESGLMIDGEPRDEGHCIYCGDTIDSFALRHVLEWTGAPSRHNREAHTICYEIAHEPVRECAACGWTLDKAENECPWCFPTCCGEDCDAKEDLDNTGMCPIHREQQPSWIYLWQADGPEPRPAPTVDPR